MSNEHNNNAPAAPHGWKLVPIEPTREMIKAMEGQWLIGSQADMAKREYSAMLATTPAPGPHTMQRLWLTVKRSLAACVIRRTIIG